MNTSVNPQITDAVTPSAGSAGANSSTDYQQHKSQAETHPVFNQPTALENFNAYDSDLALQHWVKAYGGDWATDRLSAYGARCGGDLIEAGFQANENKPKFYPHDRFGNRVDLAKFHPAYHELMRSAIEAEMHSLPWTTPKPGAHVARAAMEYLHMNADAGSGCPLTMTFAAVPALQHSPGVAKEWVPKITARHYDERNIPFFEKQGLTIGMAMTEKQGGSDVRANTTRAYAVGSSTGNGAEYEIVGHKWFCSAPMCDAFLVLAQTDSGLSCFLLPRWRPDGSKNQMYVQRLKDKLGNISNASSEVEFRGAFAWMIGDEGRGVRTIIEMVSMTRFDCMVGSSALMRGAVAQAIHHTSGRSAFGKNLHEQPLMQNVLADMAIESEAALAISMRVGHALDNLADEQQNLFARLATAVGKYWICKRAPHLAYESMESVGGVAYVEDNILPRIYREAPVNAIWEGSGNVQCLDVLRAMGKEPKVVDAFMAELQKGAGNYREFDQFLVNLKDEFTDLSTLEYRSRTVVDKLAVGLQASVLIQQGDSNIADAFIRSRIVRNGAFNYGTLDAGIDCYSIMKRAQPKL
ncbi:MULTISPECIES: acyl-CoA dehydrogenase family protein [Thalassolituus]|jgi:putative acyl-CoA dehydrogenase|uniref:acyl-CoA dehydrogenase family protein n=1 Tax=Thalassolituus TaxID=187492 RepID=UPI001E339351|nr:MULTISPECIES: acyl-CoA dehydrogenase family protein [Thalassolituus]MCB2386752.1 acyl-CoA dehydrogenase family protein [Thalassolituus alkanivorans]MCB2422672.1 acyl-CoA dehydrogenase family protein [Thalassolituus alkanivorans]